MLVNKMWIISKPSNIMEANLLINKPIKTLPTQVIETVQAHLVSTQVALEATELVPLMAWLKIIKLTFSTLWTREKHQTETKTNNKWWWRLNNFSAQLETTIKWFQAWTQRVRTLQLATITSTRPSPKLNSASKDKPVELVTQFSMKTTCQYKETGTTIIWMQLSTSTTIERDQFRVDPVTLPTKMLWMPLWILATLLEVTVLIVMLRVVTILPLAVAVNLLLIVLPILCISQTNNKEASSQMEVARLLEPLMEALKLATINNKITV